MFKLIVSALFITLALGAPATADAPLRNELAAETMMCGPDSQAGLPTESAECCKICRKGKACGDSCISRDKTCRKGPGCACDA